jgi:diadenosine tetraphosphate (Ap4A) HIT family hydrolase
LAPLDLRHHARMDPSEIAVSRAGSGGGWSGWRSDWEGQKQGQDCGLCRLRGVQENEWGIRVFTGSFIDGYLWKRGAIPGYSVASWKHDHVAEPTQLSDEQAAGYWLEVLTLGRALERIYRPTKMNYETLGNNVPHLHTHLVPRPSRDPAPNGPLPWTFLDDGWQDEGPLRLAAAALTDALTDRT